MRSKIIDCITYFDNSLMFDLRFNILKESDLNIETKPAVSNLYSKITDSVNKES